MPLKSQIQNLKADQQHKILLKAAMHLNNSGTE